MLVAYHVVCGYAIYRKETEQSAHFVRFFV